MGVVYLVGLVVLTSWFAAFLLLLACVDYSDCLLVLVGVICLLDVVFTLSSYLYL